MGGLWRDFFGRMAVFTSRSKRNVLGADIQYPADKVLIGRSASLRCAWRFIYDCENKYGKTNNRRLKNVAEGYHIAIPVNQYYFAARAKTPY